MPFFSKSISWDPKDKHIYITGASSGLGLALAHIFAARGAHLSLVARTESKLAAALESVTKARASESQRVRTFAFSVDSAEGAQQALDAVVGAHGAGGAPPDAVFLCAGAAHPGFWVETTPDDLTRGMQDGYWVQAWTAWAVSRMMVQQERHGKIVFVSSTLGYMSIPGYASYSPAKHALRGLADALRPEMLLYRIDVHIFFPPTMYTPGYDAENATKPALTLALEKDDKGLTAEQAALGLVKGVEAGEAHITVDSLTNLFRASTRGSAPSNGLFTDFLFDIAAYIGVPIWRKGMEKEIRKHAAEHRQYLAKSRLDDSEV